MGGLIVDRHDQSHRVALKFRRRLWQGRSAPDRARLRGIDQGVAAALTHLDFQHLSISCDADHNDNLAFSVLQGGHQRILAKPVDVSRDLVEVRPHVLVRGRRHLVARGRRHLLRGNRIELPWLSGKVVELGRKHGVPTPLHSFMYAALKPYIMGKPA